MAGFPAGRSFVRAVLDALARAGTMPVDMQYFAAREGQPADYCQQRVRDCDIYLAVVGFRYGSLVPGEVVSYTELEFAEATNAGLPRLVFLLDDAADRPAVLVDADRAAVDRFRQRLSEAGLICARFATPDGLELAVYQALVELSGVDTRAVPRQLPAAVAHFAGRADELAALNGLLRDRADTGGTVVISAIGGTAGVGKTTLAVYWAHQVAHRFPDGQLYVNLRGFDPGGQVMDPDEAVRRFLNALQVPADRIPADPDAQAALYRSQLAGRRMLIVLDNARDTGQVLPLLPGAPTCLVLVTSRNQLTSLVAMNGAYPISLDLMSTAEARELLAGRLGPDRMAAEPDAVERIIIRSAQLPLALAIVAARATSSPRLPLAMLAGDLVEAHEPLDALTGDDPHTDVRAVFSWSYRALTPEARRLFRLLGLHPGPDVSPHAAASLSAVTLAEVRLPLAELTRANLLVEQPPGRYTFHDLLRAYASQLAHASDSDQDRIATTRRMLDHYLHTAYAAAQLLDPLRDPILLTAPQPGVAPEYPADHQQALAWFTTERAVLLAAVDRAATTGFDTYAWRLVWTLEDFLDRRGHWHDWVTACRAALAAAGRLADPNAHANAHRHLARAYTRLGLFDDAYSHLQRALDLYHQAGDQIGEAYTHNNLAVVRGRQGRYAEALDHARRSLALHRAADHTIGQADALNLVGWYHAQLGDHQETLISCEQALTLYRRLRDRPGQAATWDSLGYAHHHLGDHDLAVICYQHAIDLYQELGDRYEEASALACLGDVHHTAGTPGASRDAWRRALTILEELDHPDAERVRVKLAIATGVHGDGARDDASVDAGPPEAVA
jgi:tetratricopeptide (TPR) repeat protein